MIVYQGARTQALAQGLGAGAPASTMVGLTRFGYFDYAASQPRADRVVRKPRSLCDLAQRHPSRGTTVAPLCVSRVQPSSDSRLAAPPDCLCVLVGTAQLANKERDKDDSARRGADPISRDLRENQDVLNEDK